MDFTEFHDRRPSAHPTDDDFMAPVTRQSIAEANVRLRTATPDYRAQDMESRITDQAKRRHRARQTGHGDFETVGDYLAHLNQG